jgi:hypothetical protein
VWSFFKKLNLELSYDPAASLLGTYLKIAYDRDSCNPCSQQPNYGIILGAHQWTNGKANVVYVHKGVLLSHKEE